MARARDTCHAAMRRERLGGMKELTCRAHHRAANTTPLSNSQHRKWYDE
jgi:hypothetical protein